MLDARERVRALPASLLRLRVRQVGKPARQIERRSARRAASARRAGGPDGAGAGGPDGAATGGQCLARGLSAEVAQAVIAKIQDIQDKTLSNSRRRSTEEDDEEDIEEYKFNCKY